MDGPVTTVEAVGRVFSSRLYRGFLGHEGLDSISFVDVKTKE
jgi:hypothetical protein